MNPEQNERCLDKSRGVGRLVDLAKQKLRIVQAAENATHSNASHKPQNATG